MHAIQTDIFGCVGISRGKGGKMREGNGTRNIWPSFRHNHIRAVLAAVWIVIDHALRPVTPFAVFAAATGCGWELLGYIPSWGQSLTSCLADDVNQGRCVSAVINEHDDEM